MPQELDPDTQRPPRHELLTDIPFALVALMIAHALNTTPDGHVLCFLPGCKRLKPTQERLLSLVMPNSGRNQSRQPDPV